MDTDGHGECAEVGAKILQAALTACDRGKWRTNAFHLGNWITDVSQGIDPLAYHKLAYQVPNTIVSIAARLNDVKVEFEVFDYTISLGFFDIDLEKLRVRAEATFAVFQGGRDGRAGKAIKRGFKWIGYHKFVHAAPKSRSRMEFSAFVKVFDTLYVQYYPHEHLDRWPDNPSAPGDDPTQVYPYLADQIKICAGLIAEIDLEWASKTFMGDVEVAPWKDDKDPDWNLWLAKLGHALHAVEDFFSHSNFIEHAIETLDPADPRRKLKPEASLEILGPSEAKIFELRQTRYSDPQGSTPETHVVTGYFDLSDTVFSSAHVVEELFPDEAPEVTTNGTKAGRLLRAVLEAVQDRTKDMKVVSEAEARAISEEVVAKEIDMTDEEYSGLMADHVPDDIRGTFHDAVAGLSAKTNGEPMSIFEVYLLMQSLADIKSYPQRFFTWLLGDAVGKVVKTLSDPLWVLTKPLAIKALENVLGRFDVGCHSLLAKDYKWEDRPGIDAIYAEAKKCSKEVHGYIVGLLTRWGTARTAAVKRTDPKTDARAFNRLRLWLWVDWLELLRYLLRHPQKTEPELADAWWYATLHGKTAQYRHYPITEAALRSQVQVAAALRRTREAAYAPPSNGKASVGAEAVGGAAGAAGRALRAAGGGR